MIFTILFLYVIVQVFLLFRIKIWNFSFLKDTVYWLLATAITSTINVDKAQRERNYFKNFILQNLTIAAIIEFIAKLYTFNFFVEIFLLVPVISLSVIISAFTVNKKEYLTLNKISNFVVACFGFIILIVSAFKILNNFQSFWMSNNLKAFFLPLSLSITFIPFLYILAVYMTYNYLFIRLDITLRDRKVEREFARKKIFALCNINLKKLNRFIDVNAIKITEFKSKKGTQILINSFKNM